MQAKKKEASASGGCVLLIGLFLTIGCLYNVISDASKGCEQEAEKEEEQAKQAAQLQAIKDDPSKHLDSARKALDAGLLGDSRMHLIRLRNAGVKSAELVALEERHKRLSARDKVLTEAHGKMNFARGAAVYELLRLDSIEQVIKTKNCEDWQAQWTRLQKIRAEEVNAGAKKAVSRLEKCRKQAISKSLKFATAIDVERRESIKEKIDEIMLEDGLDVRVKSYGKDKRSLKLENVLFDNRVMIKRYTDAGLLTTLEKAGFEKVVFSGYSHNYTYTLTPESRSPKQENDLFWKKAGLDQPLKLPTSEPAK